jgi:hypothetical protein
MEDPSPAQLQQEVKATMILFVAMISGIVMFLIISIFVNTLKGAFLQNKDYENILLFIAGALLAAALLIGNRMYRSKIEKIRATAGSLSERIVSYRGALILFMAFVEAAALFSVTCFLLTGNLIFLGFVAIVVATAFNKIPTKNNIAEAVGMTATEQASLQ